MNSNVLIVDDDAALRKVLDAILGQAGLRVMSAGSGEEALSTIESELVDVVLADLRMSGMDGMELLSRIGRRWPGLPVIMISAHATVPLAVEAMRIGACDFVTKPFDREEIVYTVQKTIAFAAERRAAESPSFDDELLSVSEEMKTCGALLARAAKTNATVLLLGESGTGKNRAARQIHRLSARSTKPFLEMHCGALPDTLLESELFGYEQGAFTGAVARKPGRVELAEGGTLFLDEIGDITPAMQVKLLRVLQERQFERLGGTQTHCANVRFIAATHRNLEELVASGEFREDLFYRLAVIPIFLPPLRSRPADVEVLALRFLHRLREEHARPELELGPNALERMTREAWPGNIRQLQNFVERLVVLSDGPTISELDVDRELRRPLMAAGPAASPAPSPAAELSRHRRDAERDAVRAALENARGNRTVAARLLGISRRTLYAKLDEYGLRGR